jgi:hypothetical protein
MPAVGMSGGLARLRAEHIASIATRPPNADGTLAMTDTERNTVALAFVKSSLERVHDPDSAMTAVAEIKSFLETQGF